MARTDFDAIIIGAGHNGLVCAGYLVRAGLRIAVVERRPVVGGAAVTEEFHPGFRNSVCSYVVSLLHPKIIHDLDLAKHGLEIIDRPAGSFLPLSDADYFWLSRDRATAVGEIAKFSERDAERYGAFDDLLTAAAEAVRPLMLETPANVGGGWHDLWRALKAGNRLRGLDPSVQTELAKLTTMSIGDYLDSWFESDPIKGAFTFEGIVGNMVSPYHGGTAYVLLHHAVGQVGGRTGAWGHAKGGMGAITEAMAKSAAERGCEIVLGNGAKNIIVEGERAVGVVLENGETLRAPVVAGNANPKILYLDLVPDGALPANFTERIESWRCRSGTFRMNVALSELPRFDALAGKESDLPFLNGTIDVCPSIAYAERAYDDAKNGGWAKEPIVSMCIPSTLDATLAPPGRHVASLFCQHFHPDLSDGRDWDDHKEAVADLIIDTVDRLAPNFKTSVVGRQVLSPKDLERDFGLVGGDIFHGALHLDQIYSLRPAPGYADYRSPLKGLYLCGAGAHPGGGVSGLPGHNAAREILADRAWKRSA